MGSINGQKYPDISARDAVEIVAALVDVFDGAPSDRDAFAREVGHESAASGAFKMKIADVRRYGLLPARGLEPTNLAETAADPRDDETERAALFRAYRNVPILDRLYDQLNGRAAGRDFSDALAELTGADLDEVERAASDVESLYARMRRYAPEESGDDRTAGRRTEAAAATTQAPAGGVVVCIGDDRLVLDEVSDTNVELARLFVESKQRERSATTDGDETGRDDPSARVASRVRRSVPTRRIRRRL